LDAYLWSLLIVNYSIIAMANRGVAKHKNTLMYFTYYLQYFCFLRLALYPPQ
jgi:hypothetical protein